MITIREALPGDVPGMLEIYNDIILNTTAVYQYDIHTLEMRKEWFAVKQEQGFPIFIAEEDEIIVGFSTIGPFRNWQAYQYTVENSVYVKADCRGRGIGKLLLQPLITKAKEMGIHTIVAGIDSTNEVSIALHKKFGFVEAAYFKEVGYKFNTWLDLIFMQLMI